MYLKSLKLVGFKSFADRTRLELRPGVTVIVGPNGSGKSNLVDAVAWVMGTQSTRALRTGKMEDVVFAGTATRPPLNRAEVTLVLDNTDRSLPLDLDEVSITRRLYRDGSSDYEINGVGCRLLDIQELLFDSGVGRHQHVIVGQGQIDSVLNAGPDDHRAVIEEAAGILKHRLRKERALRRLERTAVDVTRLRDLLGELSRQMRPLRRQAEAAARHGEVTRQLRALRLWLGGEALRAIDVRRREVVAERAELEGRLADALAEVDELASCVSILEVELGQVRDRLEGDTGAAARLETTLERLHRIAQVAHERHRALSARLEGADERRRDMEEELADLLRQREEAVAAEEQARADSDRAERAFRAAEDEERSLADQEGMAVEGALAVVRGDLTGLDAADERDRREAEAVERRLEVLTGQLEAERGEMDRINQEIRTLDQGSGPAQDRYAVAEAERRRRQADWEQADAAHREARLSVAAAAARLEAVREAAAGLSDREARGLVEGSPGAMGPLLALLDIPTGLAAAVDAALGPWMDAVAFGDAGSLQQAVGALKGAGRGGVPLLRADLAAEAAPAREVAARWGVEALVDRLGPRAHQPLADRLLGDVVLCEGWATAWEVVSRHPEVRAVTPEGDLVTTTGIRVAHPDGATPAMLEEAAAGLEAAELELARAQSRLVATRRGFESARSEEREALEALEAVEARLSGATEALARLQHSVTAVEGEVTRLRERLGALQEAAAERDIRRRELRKRLEALEGEEAERQQLWEELASQRQQAAERRERARHAWQEASALLRAVTERRAMIDARLAAVRQAVDTEASLPAHPADLARLAAVEESARAAAAIVRTHLETLRLRQAELRRELGEVEGRLRSVRVRHDECERLASSARSRLSELAVEDTELRMRGEATAEALRRHADASEEEALAAPRPELGGDATPEEVAASLEAELRRMGPVNPLAAEEYAQLEERHGFLASQLDDLERSRQELAKVVKALDQEIEGRFLAAFAEVASAYEESFRVLFPGGTGRVRLTDPDQPLTSGVEIEAQPLGKRISRMTLLSGGERSLAALAFLFAVFAARPSPFYILDEVEAALDDANLRRFLRLLDRFRQDAQLIIVTHQQQTMEAGDVLYGVTMEPGGSSRVVAKALTEVSAASSVEG